MEGENRLRRTQREQMPLFYFRDDEFFPAEVFGWHAKLQKMARLIRHLKDNDLIRLLSLPEKRLVY